MNKKLETLLTEIDNLKSKLDSLRPLPAEAMEKIKEAMEIEYTYESNRIEGNTLTLMETDFVINRGLTVSGHPLIEHLEAINHSQAIHYIKDLAKKNEPVSQNIIKDIHSIVLYGINRENAGKYRNVPVFIRGSRHNPPQPYLIEKQMEEFITAYNAFVITGYHPVLIAAFLHCELVTIHPFIDGNGRTGRLLMNLELLKNGYPIVNIKGDPQTRLDYYKSLESVQIEKDSEAFLYFTAQSLKESLERYIGIISGE